jgi:hypothetical protein
MIKEIREMIDKVKKFKQIVNEQIIGYHGSENNIIGDFKNINNRITGFYFSSDYENAKTYGEYVKKYHLHIKNPLIINVNGLKFTDDIPINVLAKYPNEEPYLTTINLDIDEIVYMVKNGKRKNSFIEIPNNEKYDGIIFKNIIDPALSSRREISQDTIVVFNNNQIQEVK